MTPDDAYTAFRRWINSHPVGNFPTRARVSPAMEAALYERAKRDNPLPFCGPDGGLLVKGCQVFDADLPDGQIERDDA